MGVVCGVVCFVWLVVSEIYIDWGSVFFDWSGC